MLYYIKYLFLDEFIIIVFNYIIKKTMIIKKINAMTTNIISRKMIAAVCLTVSAKYYYTIAGGI